MKELHLQYMIYTAFFVVPDSDLIMNIFWSIWKSDVFINDAAVDCTTLQDNRLK